MIDGVSGNGLTSSDLWRESSTFCWKTLKKSKGFKLTQFSKFRKRHSRSKISLDARLLTPNREKKFSSENFFRLKSHIARILPAKKISAKIIFCIPWVIVFFFGEQKNKNKRDLLVLLFAFPKKKLCISWHWHPEPGSINPDQCQVRVDF